MQVPEMELEVFVHGALCMAYPPLLPATSTSVTPQSGHLHQLLPLVPKVHEGKGDDVGQIVHRQEPIAVQRWIRPGRRQADRCPGAAGRVQPPGEL